MAKNTKSTRSGKNNSKEIKSDYNIKNDKAFKRPLNNINTLIGQANLSMYGTDRTSDVNDLNNKFQSLLNSQINNLTHNDNKDMTSFLGQIISSDNKSNASEEILANQFMAMTGDEYSTVQSFIYDAYRNRLLEQSDLHQVASQLIELGEAILVTRDAIVSADVVEGRMSRSFDFDNIDEDDVTNNTSIIEKMEEHFELLEKIKNFIIPKTLEYGTYYAYIIPYSKLFENFSANREKDMSGKFYRESTLMEGFNGSTKSSGRTPDKSNDLKTFIESAYEIFNTTNTSSGNQINKEAFSKDMKDMLSNITICNDEVPLPIMEEGFDSIEYMKEYTESTVTEAKKNKKEENWFDRVKKSVPTNDGITFTDEDKNKKETYDDITDCYVRMIEPTRVIPIKIMNTTIGYYYIQDEDITPLSGAVSSTLYFTKFNEHRKENTVLDVIAERIVKSFNKPFLEKNLKFKEAIVDCINYYNINEKKLKFQYIPAEYMQEFKIDEDVQGNGQSMIKKSLFYAKLYLMLLLFKIMSIILYSNDTKVNYVKQSGIDADVANKVQEIARIRQSRQINITDLFSYTTLINKIGNGNEMYIPTGRSGERPMETEILSGQDIQLNSDLLEMLKNAYILGTGVPAAILNYLNEADFAKVVEQNNTKFNGRVINYQLDFNKGLTNMYKKIMRWSTNIPENIIENFKFILQPPKNIGLSAKGEILNQFSTLADFLVQLLFDDPAQSANAESLQEEIRIFKQLLVEDQLHVIDMPNIRKLFEKSKLLALEKRLKPKADNGDSGDDLGLDDEELDDIKL